jgi:hypothetical protein
LTVREACLAPGVPRIPVSRQVRAQSAAADRIAGSRAWEIDMAKGQKRSNKEIKKPKADKKPAAVVAPSPFAKAGTAPAGGKKKR